MSDKKRDAVSPYLLLDWNDIQQMMAGNHPLNLLQMVLKDEVTYNPPVKLETGDYLTNAEYLFNRIQDCGLVVDDLSVIEDRLYGITSGLSDVSDSALMNMLSLVEDVTFAQAQKTEKGKGVLRRSGLMDVSSLKPIKRKRPIQRGANYGDPENKAFPLDTPERVKAAHAYLHKYWQQNAQSGITATYSRAKFLDVHKRITTRMRRLGLQHSAVDTLDSATRKQSKLELQAKKALKKGVKDESADGGNSASLPPEAVNIDEVNKLRNILDILFNEHITFLKNYISAKDEGNDPTADAMLKSLTYNSEDILGFINDHVLTEDSDVFLLRQFGTIWEEYIEAAMALSLGGDTGSENMAKDGARALFMAKDRLVSFFVSLMSGVADQKALDAAFVDWMTYLQQYIETRDQDDFAASYQNLKDWQKTKEQITDMLANWIVARDELDGMEMKPLHEDEEVQSEQDLPAPPLAGGTQPGAVPNQITNEPKPHYGGKPATQRLPEQLSDGAASPAAPAPASDASPAAATSYPPEKGVSGKPERSRERPMASGHKPYRSDCQIDRQSGKCYKRH